ASPLNPTKRGDVKRVGTANRIFVAQVKALYQHIPVVLLVNMVNSALVAIVLASYKGQTWWLVFLALTFALSGDCAFGWTRYRYNAGPAELNTRWADAAIFGSGLSGLLWGVVSALLLPYNLAEQTFAAAFIRAICLRCLKAFTNYLP